MPLNLIDSMTALEVTKRANNKDGALIIEAMAQTNEMLIDMPVIEANDGTVHNTLVRTSQPGGTHRKYNEGISSSASTTKTIQDRITMLEDYSVIDRDMADHSGNKELLLRTEDLAFLNGFGATQADELIYGDNGADESEINGFATRLRALGTNVISAGGSGTACTSVYVCALGPQFAHLIYPKGRSDCGVKREYLGFQNWVLDNGKKMPAYVTFFSAHYGLAVRHPNSIKRICNISSAVTADTLIEKVLEAIAKLPPGATNVAIYGNSDAMVKIDKASWSKSNAVFTKEDPWGNAITHVRKARCRTVEAILSTETALS